MVGFFDICELQFGIVREVCCCLIFVLWFGDLVSSWCVATFGFDLWLSLWFVHNSYLVFGSLIWICERELFGVFEIWICESAFKPICIIPNLI